MRNSKIIFSSVAAFSLCSGVFSAFAFVPIQNGLIWCMAVGAIVGIGSTFIAFTVLEAEVPAVAENGVGEIEPILIAVSRSPRSSGMQIPTLTPEAKPRPRPDTVVTLNYLPWLGNQNSTVVALNIPNLLEELQQLSLPHGRRLVLTQLALESLLAEPLEVILREKRSVNDAVLRGVTSRTDLIPCARVSSTVTKDEFWKFVTKQYNEVVIVAPETERKLWLSLFVVPEKTTVKSPPPMTPSIASPLSVNPNLNSPVNSALNSSEESSGEFGLES